MVRLMCGSPERICIGEAGNLEISLGQDIDVFDLN